MLTVEQLMTQAPVFAGLPPAHLNAIAQCGHRHRAQTGAILVHQGEQAETFLAGARAVSDHDSARG
jgi:hypothetical protein